jgi:SAM-dependent methyltransferase
VNKEIVDHFQKTWKEYDEWYEAHPALFRTELAALRKAVPARGRGLEVGVGTGQFAAALSIPYGLDPSSGMLGPARRKGIQVVQGFGEAQPFRAGSFDYVIAVFVIEFVDDLRGFLAEAGRILRSGGVLVTGFIDRDSAWGRHFLETSQARSFFHPPWPRELIDILAGLGLGLKGSWQTLFGPPPDLEEEEEPRTGFGQGGFVVLKSRKMNGKID